MALEKTNNIVNVLGGVDYTTDARTVKQLIADLQEILTDLKDIQTLANEDIPISEIWMKEHMITVMFADSDLVVDGDK